MEQKAITVRQLKELLDGHLPLRVDEPVSVLLSLPSVGPRAHADVVSAQFGIDWDRGLLLGTKERLVPKNEKQDLWEAAFDLILYLATKPCRRQSYEIRRARQLLIKNGWTEEKINNFRHLYHKVVAEERSNT